MPGLANQVDNKLMYSHPLTHHLPRQPKYITIVFSPVAPSEASPPFFSQHHVSSNVISKSVTMCKSESNKHYTKFKYTSSTINNNFQHSNNSILHTVRTNFLRPISQARQCGRLHVEGRALTRQLCLQSFGNSSIKTGLSTTWLGTRWLPTHTNAGSAFIAHQSLCASTSNDRTGGIYKGIRNTSIESFT